VECDIDTAAAICGTVREALGRPRIGLSALSTSGSPSTVEPERYDRDRGSAEVDKRIDRDLASGEQSGVEGTPTFYVNGTRHDGGYDLDSLRSAIQVHLDSATRSRRDTR
jgi:hypothetical protein